MKKVQPLIMQIQSISSALYSTPTVESLKLLKDMETRFGS